MSWGPTIAVVISHTMAHSQRLASSGRLLALIVLVGVIHTVAALSVQDVVSAVQDAAAAALTPDNLQKYKAEMLGLCLAVLYIMSYLRGVGAIKQIARAWVK
jgi:hypothetical protein